MTCQHPNGVPERDKDKPALDKQRRHGVLRVYRCLDCGEGKMRFLLREELCQNCHDPSAEGGHLGAQGWLCDPSPEVARTALLTNALLSARER